MNVKSFFLFLVVGSTFNCFSQNLVPNGSFEEFSECPYALDQVDFCNDWVSSLGSCDYYNACKIGDLGGVGVPTNFSGSQYAKDFAAYAGLVTFDVTSSNYREILSCELNEDLIPLTTYYFSLYYCRGGEGPGNSVSSNNLGIRFSSENLTTFSELIVNSSQLYIDTIINDSTNWNQLKGTIIVNEPVSHLYIGNFFDDSNTLYAFDGNQLNYWAYYYIDDIKLSTDSNFVYSMTLEKKKYLTEIYPSIFNTVLNIETNYASSEVSFFLENGTLIYTVLLDGSTTSINTTSWKKGLYLIQIKRNDSIQTFKVIKIE